MAFAFKSNYPQIARESGFRLRQFKDGPLDWRLVGSIEVERILREQQFEHLDAVLFHLSEAPLASMLDSNVLDSGVAKYFTLSQLALQYMIFCRKFLDESVRTLRDNIVKLETQNIHLRTINQEHTDNVMTLQKKLSQVEAIHEIVFPCHVCTKNFVSNDALNIHLTKKHLKSPSIDQGKEKDQTLINTIKLELEIKQLKERLNTAEKDIRQKSEVNKLSAREITNLNLTTQLNIQTQNVGTQVNFENTKINNFSTTNELGTQCNLLETKEFDSTECKENYKIVNVENQPNCDVNSVESSKVEILFDIKKKISNLESLQETYSGGNQQSINEIKRKLADITDFLKTQPTQNAKTLIEDAVLPSSSNQILPLASLDELHRILSNMFSEVSQMNFERTNRIITRIEKNYEQKLSTLEDEKNEKLQPHQKMQALEYEHSMDIKKDEPFEKKISSFQLGQTSDNIERTKKYSSSDASSEYCSSTNTSHVESHHSYLIKNERASGVSNALNNFENKMAFYGLNINSKNITLPEAETISGNLLKQRSALKEMYPTFNKTRNRLNKLVELFISEKHSHRDRFKKHDKNHKEIDISVQNNKLPLSIDQSITSKKIVDRILMSPIKKPRNHNRDETKPVPMPRKHVMFHTESEGITDREFLKPFLKK